MNEINTWTAWQMAEAINRGDVSAEEVTQSCLDRIAERENAVKAWAFWDPDLALRQARACDEHRTAGNPLNLLHGVPVGLKDIIDTADMPTENGSDHLKGRRPTRDAASVALLLSLIPI